MSHVVPLVAAVSLAAPLYAIDPSGWRYEQTVTCGGGPLCCLELSDTTIGTLRPGLEDLRLTDASGREVAWLAEESAPVREVKAALSVRPKSVKIELRDRETVLVLETGVGIPIDRVDLESPGVEFLKPVRVEVSQDGETWTVQATRLPVFRRKNGAQNLTLYPGRVCAAFIRLTVDDSAGDPAPFTGVGLVTAPTVVRAGSDRRIPVLATSIASRAELAGVTRLHVDLGAANLPLCSISLATPEALFMRRVSVRPASGSASGKVAAVSAVWRVPDSSGGANARLVIPMETVVPTRDIVLEIENGDSPPLAVVAVAAERRPRRIFSRNPKAGAWSCGRLIPWCRRQGMTWPPSRRGCVNRSLVWRVRRNLLSLADTRRRDPRWSPVAPSMARGGVGGARCKPRPARPVRWSRISRRFVAPGRMPEICASWPPACRCLICRSPEASVRSR